MSEMVERVAWAMMKATETPETGPVKEWEDQHKSTRDSFLTKARAAIAAMREPTEGMIRAVHIVVPDARAGRSLSLAEVWRVMTDAALRDAALL